MTFAETAVDVDTIKLARVAAGLSQMQAAHVLLRTHAASWHEWEKGRRPMPEALFVEFLKRTGLLSKRDRLHEVAMARLNKRAAQRSAESRAGVDARAFGALHELIGRELAQYVATFKVAWLEEYTKSGDRARAQRRARNACQGLIDKWQATVQGPLPPDIASGDLPRAIAQTIQLARYGTLMDKPVQPPDPAKIRADLEAFKAAQLAKRQAEEAEYQAGVLEAIRKSQSITSIALGPPTPELDAERRARFARLRKP